MTKIIKKKHIYVFIYNFDTFRYKKRYSYNHFMTTLSLILTLCFYFIFFLYIVFDQYKKRNGHQNCHQRLYKYHHSSDIIVTTPQH